MKKIRIIALGLVFILSISLLVGCGSKGSSAGDDKVIKVAASPTPHAEILEQAKELLEEKGFTLEITEFNDYVQPNEVVQAGDYTANYFQHGPYLDDFNAEKGTDLVSVAKIHYEPFGIYPGTTATLDVQEGATIAVPNDTTNEARALLLLQENGILTLKEGAGLTATKNDIVENPRNVEIVELEAAQVPRVVNEVDFVVLNGNYALEAGFVVGQDALAVESADSEAAQTYANIICVKAGNEELESVKALVSVLQGEEIRSFIEETYAGAVIPIQ